MTAQGTTMTTNRTPLITFTASVHISASPEATFDALADLRTHLRWSGTAAPDANFRLLTLDVPESPAQTYMTFTSTGANGMGMTFHDRSVITEATRPVLAFRTDSRLARKHRPEWQAQFLHRYEVSPERDGARVDYRVEVYPRNYRPFWLHPLVRPMTGMMIPRKMARNMQKLAMSVEDPSR